MNIKRSRIDVLTYFFAAVTLSILSFVAISRSAENYNRRPTRGHSRFDVEKLSQSAHVKNDVDWAGVYGKLPLAFEKNRGQSNREVLYASHGRGYGLFLTAHEAVLALRHNRHPRSSRTGDMSFRDFQSRGQTDKTSVIRMNFEGANSATRVGAIDHLPGRVNYFVGNDPKNWHTDIPTYARVKYTGIYPGIDLVFYGNQDRLEYDFVIAPGSDPSAIKMKLEGANTLRINSHGDLLLSFSGGEVTLQKPVIYQKVNGTRKDINGRYYIAGKHVGFAVANYDRSEPLILDPVLNYSTYLGGSSGDTGNGIAVDGQGNAFVTGSTLSMDFPTTVNAYNKGPLAANPSGAVFVTELNPAGTQQIYSTYLAGTAGALPDAGLGIALDSSGKIYVTGETSSVNFPTTPNALKQGPLVTNGSTASFISKLDPTLSGTASLVYSSYLSGSSGPNGDYGSAIAADANGNAYITGLTYSPAGTGPTAFPTTSGAFQSTLSSPLGNGFLTRIDTTKSGNASLVYSTYLGGNGANASSVGFGDGGFGVAVDSNNIAYLTGVTTSTNFPTTPTAFKPTPPAAVAKGTTFVSKIDTTQAGTASLRYSTYLGGEASDYGLAIALGPNNVAYVTGTTNSLSFPTMPAGAYQTTGSTSGAAFIALVDTGLTGSASLKYSTFLGSGGTTGFGIRVDATGKAYVAGATQSALFPITRGALQIAPAPGAPGSGFISQLNPGGKGSADLTYSTYFGGSGSVSRFDTANAIAIDSSNNAYITGVTFSANFPISPNPGAFQTTLKGSSDAFVTKLSLVPVVDLAPTTLAFGGQFLATTSAAKTVTLTNNGNATLAITSIGITGGDFTQTNTCGSSVAKGATCTISVTFSPTILGARTGTLTITHSANNSPQTIPLTGSGWDFNLSVPTTMSVNQGASGNVTVTVTPLGGFNSAVSLACSGTPALATCTISPASVTPADGVTPVTATLSVTTTAFVSPQPLRTPLTSLRQVLSLLSAFVMFLALLYAARLRTPVAMATIGFILIVLAGCGGSTHDKTPKGTSNLTVTATSGSITKTATVALTVN